MNLRDMLSAGVRLNLIGPLRAGAVQAELGMMIPRLSAAVKHIEPGTAHQVAPLLEIMAAAHDRLYTRMFNS